MKFIIAAIMCPTFCMEEPPPLCEIEQVCEGITFDNGGGGFSILPIPLALLDRSGGANESFIPKPPRMPAIPNNPYVPYPPTIPPTIPPNHPLPENPPTAVVPEPSSLAIMGLISVIGLLTMRKKNGTSNP